MKLKAAFNLQVEHFVSQIVLKWMRFHLTHFPMFGKLFYFDFCSVFLVLLAFQSSSLCYFLFSPINFFFITNIFIALSLAGRFNYSYIDALTFFFVVQFCLLSSVVWFGCALMCIFQYHFSTLFCSQILTDAALLKRQKKEIEDLRAKLMVDIIFSCYFLYLIIINYCLIENKQKNSSSSVAIIIFVFSLGFSFRAFGTGDSEPSKYIITGVWIFLSG